MRKHTWLVVLLVPILSFACVGSPSAKPTPTSDYIFTPVTTPLKIEPDALPNARTGEEYEVEIRVSDNVTPVNQVSISQGTLPAGLELVFIDQTDGAKIVGVPEEAGVFTFTVWVSCFGTMVSGQSKEKQYTLVVEN